MVPTQLTRSISCVVNGGRQLTLLIQISVVLTALAIYNVSRITTLHLPLSASASVLAVVIPVGQVAGGVWLFMTGRLHKQVSLDLASVCSVLDAVLITIASMQLSEQSMTCQLDTTWRLWFQHKDGRAIRDIQNRLECCGLRSAVDKAWPFPDKSHNINACKDRFGHDNGCFAGWAGLARNISSIFVAIGVVSLLIKASIGICEL